MAPGIISLLIGGFFGILSILFMFGYYVWYRRNLKTAEPSEVMIVSDKATELDDLDYSKVKVFIGGKRFVHPWKEIARKLSISVKQINVELEDVTTKDGIEVSVSAVADVAILSDSSESIMKAARSYFGQEGLIDIHTQNRISGVLRSTVATYEANNLRSSFTEISESVYETSREKFTELGLRLYGISITELTDKGDYFANLGRKTVAEVKEQAEIAESNAKLSVSKTENTNAEELAESKKERIKKETEAEKEIADALAKANNAKELADIREQQSLATERQKLADLDTLYLQKKYHNEVVLPAKAKEEAKVEAEKVSLAMRAERDLADKLSAETRIGTIKSEAEAKATATKLQAEAEAEAIKQEGIAKAEAEAEKIKALGTAKAEVMKAEAEAITAKGTAEAGVRRALIEAENSVSDKVLSLRMAEIAPKVAEAIANGYKQVGNITLIGGDGRADGLQQAVTKGIAQFGGVFEALTGKNPFGKSKPPQGTANVVEFDKKHKN